MAGFHHEPRAAGTFVPGLAASSIGDVSGLAKSPSTELLMSLPTLELGKSASNLSLVGGAPTPKRLVLSPVTGGTPTLKYGGTTESLGPDEPTVPADLTALALANEAVPVGSLPPGSGSSSSSATQAVEQLQAPANAAPETAKTPVSLELTPLVKAPAAETPTETPVAEVSQPETPAETPAETPVAEVPEPASPEPVAPTETPVAEPHEPAAPVATTETPQQKQVQVPQTTRTPQPAASAATGSPNTGGNVLSKPSAPEASEATSNMYTDGTYWRTGQHDAYHIYEYDIHVGSRTNILHEMQLCPIQELYIYTVPLYALDIFTCRMDRYFKSVQRGKATATPEVVKLWGSDSGSGRVASKCVCMYAIVFTLYQTYWGQKLRELLLAHGSMKEVNLEIQRETIQDWTLHS